MIDNTTPTDDVTPEEMAKILARTQRGTTSADTDAEERMQARSVKMPKELVAQVTVRAAELGMSRSAYFRWLAEKDLHEAYSDTPEMVPLEQARALVTSAVESALAQLSHRAGHHAA